MASSPLAAFASRNEAAGPRQITADDIPRKLDQLSKAASTRNAYTKETVEHLVDQFSSYANFHGLSHVHLESLLRILTLSKTYLDGPKTKALVKSLVPQGKIRPSTVIHLIGALGEGEHKAEYATQGLLLRWLVMVYDFLEGYSVLQQLYSVIFNFLYTANLRAHACHLLALCTRRKDVKPFRIQALMKLHEDHSDETGVVGLLQIYQSFYPDVILRGSRRRSVFKIWDPIWLQNATLVRSRQEDAAKTEYSAHDPHRRRSTRVLTKSKRGIVPVLHTFEASETSVTLEEIDSIKGLVDNLQKLELPSQVGAVYHDDLFRNFVLLKGSDEIMSRLESWTSAALLEELDVEQTSGSPSERLEVFLGQILDYVSMEKSLLASVHDFLREYIESWNGKWHRDQILGILSCVQFSHLQDLQNEFFTKLETLLMNDSAEDVSALIRFHTSYLRNVVTRYNNSQNQAQEADIRGAVRQYVLYVDRINSEAIINFQSKSNVISILHTALEFYNVVVRASIQQPIFEIVYPSDTVVYSSVFLGDAVSFSVLCGILAVYKQAFLDHTELRSKDPRLAKYGEPDRAYVDHFNGFLMDISNFFWRARCFSRDPTKDMNANGCLMREDFVAQMNNAANARELLLGYIFGVTHSATFSRFNNDCLTFLQDRYEEVENIDNADIVRHKGPVTSKSLQGLAGDGGYRIEYRVFKMASLEYLRRSGFEGVYSLIYSTMKKLREEAGKHNVAAMFEGLEQWHSGD
ncbi:hypothetical protein TWF694_007584 [Orbilia ellipsospora]|uniref:Mis6 domain-containing protein n=1 Tax=Orbilia ellipsospora TaxID=2528407 RepID=A0AAV9XI84_9PEZI